MKDLVATIDTYLSAWNESDVARRAALIEAAWATDGRLIDPPLAAEGHAKISDLVSALHAQFPGHRFRGASGIDAHHDHLRFAWELVAPDGRLRRITGFFGPLPVDASLAAQVS